MDPQERFPLLDGAVAFAPGYSSAWPLVLDDGVPVEARTLAGVEPGPHGDCWSNARAVVVADPERFVYVEGLVVSPKPRYGRGWQVTAGLLYPHAWVADDDGHYEVTHGWTELTNVAVYYPGPRWSAAGVSAVLAAAERRPWYRDAPAPDKAVSLLELLEVLA